MTEEAARKALAERRDRIDEIDRRLLDQINERTRIVQEIGEIKEQVAMPIYEPKREEEVFANVVSHNRGPLPPDAAKRIFERIIDEMRTVQKLRMTGGEGNKP